MQRTLWATATLVVLTQVLHMRDTTAVSLELTILPTAALTLFFCGLAFAARGLEAPPPLVIAAAMGGLIVAVSSARLQSLPPAVELTFSLWGAACLIAVAAWISVQYRPISAASSLLAALGGAAGMVVFCRGAWRLHQGYSLTEGGGLGQLVAHARELTLGFGLGAVLLFAAGFLSRRRTDHSLPH